MFLHHAPFWLRAIYPDFVWRMPTSEKVLHLTFDDGPIPDVTEFVIGTLEAHAARATFFCIGDNVRKHPDIYQQVIEGGHAVGNHTFNHLNGWKTANATYTDNIRHCDAQLGIATRLFRPPYGRIKRTQASALLPDRNIVMWDVLSGDFSREITPETCLRKTIQYGRPGSIVLFHDSLKARKNMEYTLPRVLDHFGALGYRFTSLPMNDPAL
jgi:peptidoglycan-N-acetylglucosamine deacetylase